MLRLMVSPWQMLVLFVVRLAEANEGIMVPVDDAALVPHTFDAFTETDPFPEPIVTVALVVPWPPVTDHPDPIVDHV